MSEIKLTEGNFEKEVLESDIPVLVDFYADWCGPCKMLAPVLAQIAEENEGVVKVGKLNTDDEMNLAMKYKISAIPAVLCFKNGQVSGQSVGYTSKEALEELFK